MRHTCTAFQHQYSHAQLVLSQDMLMYMCTLVHLKPGIETRHGVFYVFLNQAHKPGILHFTKLFLVLHVALQYFSIPRPYFHYDQEKRHPMQHIITPAHTSKLASSPGCPFPLLNTHNVSTCTYKFHANIKQRVGGCLGVRQLHVTCS